MGPVMFREQEGATDNGSADGSASNPAMPFLAMLSDWNAFYLRHFNLEFEAEALHIPGRPAEMSRLVVMVHGITLTQIILVCVKNRIMRLPFDFHEVETLPAAHERTTRRTTYAVWVGADDEGVSRRFAGLSSDDVAARGIKGVTLPERMMLQLKHFAATGQQFSQDFATVCSGSREMSCGVPILLCVEDRFEVWSHGRSMEKCHEKAGVVPVYG